METNEQPITNKPKDAKILTSKMQDMCIMRNPMKRKSIKFVVETSLKNPFTLDWPIISENHQKEILQLIKDSFANMKKNTPTKPPWSEVCKFKGRERRQFLEDHKRNYEESLNKDPTAVKQQQKLLEDWSHVILGYNAVMRGVEQQKLIGVLFKKDVQPQFLTKTFLPGCTNNNIPLIPVADLDTLLKDQSTMGLQHSCLVIGLRTSAANLGCRYFNLFSKMCEALNMDPEDVVGTDDRENSESDMDDASIEEANKNNNVHRKEGYKMSEEEMSKYYLKRTNKKKRMFTPGEEMIEKIDVDYLGFGSDFVSLGATEIDIPIESTRSLTLIDRQSSKENVQNSTVLATKEKTVQEKWSKMNLEINTICNANVDVSSMDTASLFVLDSGGGGGGDENLFVLDTSGSCDEKAADEFIVGDTDQNEAGESSELKDNENLNTNKRKKNKDPHGQSVYIPAKVKRIKPNPNKK